jgi:hypothetical protein
MWMIPRRSAVVAACVRSATPILLRMLFTWIFTVPSVIDNTSPIFRLLRLAFGHDGELYGVAGGAPGYSHLFRYDPRDGFVDLSNPIARSETLRSTAPCRPRPCRGHRAGSAGSRNRCRGTSLRA